MKTRRVRTMCDTARHRVSPLVVTGEKTSRSGHDSAATSRAAECGEIEAAEIRRPMLAGRQECVKMVGEMNRVTAQYCHLAVTLGCRCDSEAVRRQLTRCRKRACELARRNTGKLLPHVRGTCCDNGKSADYEKLWITSISCLELFHRQLLKSKSIIRTFPLNSRQIDIGITTNTNRLRQATISRRDQGAAAARQRSFVEDDLTTMQRDICDIEAILREMYNTVGVQPWTIEPDTTAYRSFDSQSSNSTSTSSRDAVTTIAGQQWRRKRKTKCVVAAVLLFAVSCVVVIATCAALLT